MNKSSKNISETERNMKTTIVTRNWTPCQATFFREVASRTEVSAYQS